MQRVRLSSAWMGTGTKADPYRPKFMTDHPTYSALHNITGTAPGGACSVDADLDDATYAAVMADPTYNLSVQPLGAP
jgi:hypothetical protein